MTLLRALLALGWVAAGAVAGEPVSRIGFGSCYKPEKSTPLWRGVSAFDPQVWLWLGDNVYNDVLDGEYFLKNLPADAFTRGYARLAQSEGMAALKNLPTGHVMATWDDHDYGRNDAGQEWDRKEEAKKSFVMFWGGEERPDGVYSSRDFGPEGKRLRVILLDTRFSREKPGPRTDPLGARQWQWLEAELKKPGADLVVLGSSIQVLAGEHSFESWTKFPQARARLLRLLGEVSPPVLVVSGDRHHGEISRFKTEKDSRVLYDVTSSGLTEKSTLRGEPNSLRVGEVHRGGNFGALTLDWSVADPTVLIQIRDAEGKIVGEVRTTLRQLAPPSG